MTVAKVMEALGLKLLTKDVCLEGEVTGGLRMRPAQRGHGGGGSGHGLDHRANPSKCDRRGQPP